MDSSTQLNQSQHLKQLALEELELSRTQLADAGRAIDELRSDALALATRVDGARAEAEAFRLRLEQEQQKNLELQPVQDALRSTISDLEAHVARLKKQLERPGRLMAKKVLRRGPYSSPDAP